MAKITKRYARNDKGVDAYHDMHDKLMLSSSILNSGADIPNPYSIIWTKKNIEDELTTLTGDEHGQYRKGKETILATIPSLNLKLDELKVRFDGINADREKRGYTPFEDYPSELLHEKLVLEAKMDVALSEKDYLQERLEKGEQQEEKVRTDDVLKYGLRQQIILKDGFIDTIDGQKVEYIDEMPVISDKSSPYRGMSVKNYRTLADQWVFNRKKAEIDKFKKLCKELKANGKPVPTMPKVSSIKVVDKNSLPPFPKEFTNHFKSTKD